jgi:hypothetical protein
MDVGEGHVGVEAGRRGDPQRVQPGVGVRQLHPPGVLSDVEQHRIVHDAAVRRGHDHVLPLFHGAVREIATRDHVDQPVGVPARHLHGALDPDVPHRHAGGQEVVLDLGIVEVPGQVHVVVDVVGGTAGSKRCLEEG